MKEKIISSIYGAAIGDALGVPVEFLRRENLNKNPVKCMMGHGTHNQPAGTWSDDTSMILATMDGICKGNTAEDLMKCYHNWIFKAKYTARNEVFDYGNTTIMALRAYDKNKEQPDIHGLTGSESNGNGSLMRVLPYGLYGAVSGMKLIDIVKLAGENSKLTHAHVISKACCGWYCAFIADLLVNKDLYLAWGKASDAILSVYGEIPELIPVLYQKSKDRTEISSTGYVVHSLEAAMWCIFNSESFDDAVLSAVNLGDDTDTIASITGGIAGIYYDSIPQEWIDSLLGKDKIDSIINKFIGSVYGKKAN